jgi:thioredoxin-related protein
MFLSQACHRLSRCLWAALILGFTFGYSSSAAATEVQAKGAELGKWTQDYDAALALAKEKELPLLLNFTGSDWCGYCIQMDKQVFSQAGWTEYAQSNVVLVTVDFPKNEARVPEAYRQRNQELQQRFGIEGYPTFVVLAADGKTELGRLSAEQGTNVQTFSSAITALLRRTEKGIAAMAKSLPEATIATYRQELTALHQAEEKLRTWLGTDPEPNDDNKAKYGAFQEEITKHERALQQVEMEYTAGKLSPEKAAAYREAYAKRRAAEGELESWLKGNPEPNEANRAKFRELMTKVQKLQQEQAALE